MTIDLIIAAATDHANKARAANRAAMHAIRKNLSPECREAFEHNIAATMHWEAVLDALGKLRRDTERRAA